MRRGTGRSCPTGRTRHMPRCRPNMADAAASSDAAPRCGEHFERRARSGLESAPVHGTDRRLDLDLKSRRNVQDPFPVYTHLREHDPLHWSASLNAWVVTRWRDVVAV